MVALRTLPLQRSQHGSGFRALGLRSAGQLSPFLGVDHAWMSAPTFPPHSHVGFSAVSYLFEDAETGIHNSDSLGTRNLIRPGGLHWTIAGRGIVHEEVPAETGKTVHSLQIFIDLPVGKKDMAPGFISLEPESIPVVCQDGARVRVVAGAFAGTEAPINPPTAVVMLDIALDPGASLTLPLAQGQGGFVMPISGLVAVGEHGFSPEMLQVPVFEAEDRAQTVTIRAPQGAARAMFFGGLPLQP